MKVIKLDTVSGTTTFGNITLIPRKPILPGSNVIMNLRDEIDDTTKEINGVFYEQLNEYTYLTLDIDDDFYKVGHKYEFSLRVIDDKYYEGRLVCIDINDSIQDYRHTTITPTNKLKF